MESLQIYLPYLCQAIYQCPMAAILQQVFSTRSHGEAAKSSEAIVTKHSTPACCPTKLLQQGQNICFVWLVLLFCTHDRASQHGSVDPACQGNQS